MGSLHISILDGSLFFTVSLIFVIASFLGYFSYIFTGNKLISKLSFIALIIALAIQTFAFVERWIYSYQIGVNTPPLVDLYDSLVFFAYVVILGFILIRIFYDFDVLGFIISIVAGLALTFASFSPLASNAVEPTIPALQSPWLIYHIVTLFIAYGAFGASFGLGILYLLKYKTESNSSKKREGFLGLLPPSEIIDEAVYKVIVFGLVFLTAGVVIGAAWANSAWGGFWSWDPKETWSLITWITYILFVHARITKGWAGKKMAWIAIIGFAVVIFCYLGVDIIIPGLHSYATAGSTSVL